MKKIKSFNTKITDLNSLPTGRPEAMNPITSLPIIQIDHLPDRPVRDQDCHNHEPSLRPRAPHPHQHMGHKPQQQTHHRIQEPDCEPLRPELHSRTLIEEHQLRWVIPIGQKHGHLPNYIVHRPGNAEEVDEHGEEEPDLPIVKKGVPRKDSFDEERD